jgi:hypothetical protein
MPSLKTHLVAFGLLFSVAAVPALAASSAASSASESLTTSVGSLSNSVQGSSDSSTKTTALTEGEYRIVAVAELPERPGMLRMKLQALGTDAEFFLTVPQAAFEQGQLAQGQVVAARARPYGFEFANGETRRAFFLVLADDWYRELQTKAVAL